MDAGSLPKAAGVFHSSSAAGRLRGLGPVLRHLNFRHLGSRSHLDFGTTDFHKKNHAASVYNREPGFFVESAFSRPCLLRGLK